MVETFRRELATRAQGDAHDITAVVADAVTRSAAAAGIVTVFVVGSTAGVTTIEFEPGASPISTGCSRRSRRGPPVTATASAGAATTVRVNVRAALLGPSLTVPFANRELLLGTWQQTALVEFDTRPRKRELVMQIIGE
jgi:secondary thiamine-phosphate synthase enzyme